MVSTRQFGGSDWAVRDPETGQTHLVDEAENVFYGIEVAFPETTSDSYRVELVKTIRQAQEWGAEQRLILEQYPSQMEAEESQAEWETKLYEQGMAAIALPLARDEQPSAPDTDETWGWHEAQFVVLAPTEKGQPYQSALFEIYRDALSGDIAGSYLTLGHHGTSDEAQATCDQLEAAAFEWHDSSAGWGRFAEEQVAHPIWHGMQPEHYGLYERLMGPSLPPDQPDPLLASQLPLVAPINPLEEEEHCMSQPHHFHAERSNWQVDLKEDVTYLEPHISAEYHTPVGAEGLSALRLRPEADTSMYGLEVSSPDEAGDVTLSATKHFESDLLQKPMVETVALKTYHSQDFDETLSYLDPRSQALHEARALVYEWGRHDLDHAMGSALQLAQANGFKGDHLFEHGPPDTFSLPEEARSLATIQAEREWERAAEHFAPLPKGEPIIHAREVGRYGVDDAVEAGLFYGVAVRAAQLGEDHHAPPLYVVEGVKAWLDPESGQPEQEWVTLDVRGSQSAAIHVADGIADEPDVVARLERMEALAHEIAQRADHLTLPLLGQTPAELLQLQLRGEGLFERGPSEPERPYLMLDDTPPLPEHWPVRPDYARTVGEAAYDLPLEAGQAYEFRLRSIPELESEVARYGVDALALETVKHWQTEGGPQSEVVTLSLYHDRAEARQALDSYIDVAESMGIQAAMSQVAAQSDAHTHPTLSERAEELDLYLNHDIRDGELFTQGPPDPFLSAREINHLEQQYAAAHPALHELSLAVVPVHSPEGVAQSHRVVAFDAYWEAEETSRELLEAEQVTALAVAQFPRPSEADFYAAALHEYLYKHDLPTAGADLQPSLDFLGTLARENGFTGQSQPLSALEIEQVANKTWAVPPQTEVMQPVPITNPALEVDF